MNALIVNMRNIIILTIVMFRALAAATETEEDHRSCFFRCCCCFGKSKKVESKPVFKSIVPSSVMMLRPASLRTIHISPSAVFNPPSTQGVSLLSLPEIDTLQSTPREALGIALGKLECAIQSGDFSSDEPITGVADVIKSTFRSGVSGEVRGYIHDIMRCLTNIRYGFEKDKSTEVTQSLTEGLKYLYAMVPKLHGQVMTKVFEPVRLVDLIGSIRSFCALSVEQAGVEFTCDISAELNTLLLLQEEHMLALQRVLCNLMTNAIEYRVRSGHPKVLLTIKEFFEGEKPQVHFTLKDNGLGIAAADLSKIFLSGYRAEATSHIQGSGLGLDNCLSLVTRTLGGAIKATSEGLGMGAEFEFKVPYALFGGGRKLEITKRKIDKSAMKVLIVEDQIICSRMFVALCQRLGFKFLDVAKAEDEAVGMFNLKKHNLILMDNVLSPGSGIEATKKIRQLPSGEMPVIFSISGVVDKQSEDEFIACGMNSCFPKPLSQAGFIRLLGIHFDFTPTQPFL